MPRKLALYIAQKIVHPVMMAYLDIYTTDDEPSMGSVRPGYDPRSTTASSAEIATNHDHDVLEVVAFGFTSQRGTTWKLPKRLH